MITTDELALAGVAGTLLGAAVGGLLTYCAQRLSTKDTIIAQRALSHDERLWQHESPCTDRCSVIWIGPLELQPSAV